MPGSKTTLAPPVVDLMKMIFDVQAMYTALKSYDVSFSISPERFSYSWTEKTQYWV